MIPGVSEAYCVIPAQAGIQRSRFQRLPWTPAFAGVTSKRLIQHSSFRVGHLAGTLQPSGWLNIRRLMIHRKPPQYIEFAVLLDKPRSSIAELPYAGVLREFSKHGRCYFQPLEKQGHPTG
jgi:hypothetical protein